MRATSPVHLNSSIQHYYISAMITLLNNQNVMETRLAKLYQFEAAEFENDRNVQLSSSFRVTVMARNFTFFN